jgi:multidrug resistance efflux pump
MKPQTLAPIPVPFRQRWLDLRMRLLPVAVFGAAVCAVVVLWRGNVAVPAMIGQAEPVLASVSSQKPGLLVELDVARFQKVKAGDKIGQVMTAEPKLLESSLAVIRAEIEALRVGLSPLATQQHNAMDYSQLRMDWMKQRVQLAGAQVNLQLAESEWHRTEELFKGKFVSAQELDQAKAAYERLRREVAELTGLVAECEVNIKNLQVTNALDIAKISQDPLQAAIAVQESKLRLAEAELAPVTLRAPIDGVVAAVFHQSGEAVIAGQPIVAIATLNSVRIVGYLRPPIVDDLKPGMRVEVRTRGLRREAGPAQIVEVGSQLESVPPALMGAARLAGVDLALPVDISLPLNLHIRPGELVDITIVSRTD